MSWPQIAAARSPIGAAVSRLLPVLTTGLATLLALLPVPLPGYAVLTPSFALMAVYHWTIYRPDRLPPTALFSIGLVYDLLSGDLPGCNAVLFVLSRTGVLRSRRLFVNRNFRFIWIGFVILVAVNALVSWAAHSILAWYLFSFSGSALAAGFTVALFPIASFLLGQAQRALAETV